MKTQILSGVRLTFLCIILFLFVYSGAILGLAKLLAPNEGEGEQVSQSGKVVGFANVGQEFKGAKYFWPRPSAAGYNPSASAGSNKGPTNPDYLLTVRHRVDLFISQNPGTIRSQVTAELVTASGSGLDPHISPASAYLQVKRIAAARKLPVDKVNRVVTDLSVGPWLGFMGPRVVNVLALNIALDKLK